MRNYLFPLALVAFVVILSSNAKAAEKTYFFSIEQALNKHRTLVDPNIGLYFATQPHGEIVEDLGTFISNKKTNARNKTPDVSCPWVFMSAIKSLQGRAASEGGNAVVNIHSFYDRIEMFSETKYECHDSKLSGVTLQGTVVRLEK